MTDIKATRLSKIARELNVGISTIVDFLHKKGMKIDTNPNTKVTPEQYDLLLQEYSNDLSVKRESEKLNLKHLKEKQETITLNDLREEYEGDAQDFDEVLIKDSSSSSSTFETETEKEIERGEKIKLNILGKINIEKKDKKVQKKEEEPVRKEKAETEQKSKQEADKAEKKADADKDVSEDKEVEEAVLQEEEELDFPMPEKKELEVKVLGKIDLESMNQRTRPPRKTKEQKETERKARIAAKQKEYEGAKTAEKEPVKKAGGKGEAKSKEKVKGADEDQIITGEEAPVTEKEDTVLSDFKRKRRW
jgi:translation initiation factor IF-2